MTRWCQRCKLSKISPSRSPSQQLTVLIGLAVHCVCALFSFIWDMHNLCMVHSAALTNAKFVVTKFPCLMGSKSYGSGKYLRETRWRPSYTFFGKESRPFQYQSIEPFKEISIRGDHLSAPVPLKVTTVYLSWESKRLSLANATRYLEGTRLNLTIAKRNFIIVWLQLIRTFGCGLTPLLKVRVNDPAQSFLCIQGRPTLWPRMYLTAVRLLLDIIGKHR